MKGPISVSLTIEMIVQLKKIAKEADVPVSTLVEKAITIQYGVGDDEKEATGVSNDSGDEGSIY